MKMVEHKLTADEKARNMHGPMHIFKYTKKNLGSFAFRMYAYNLLQINFVI